MTPFQEKTKPFRLVKYFFFTSLIVIFLAAVVLSVLNTYWVRTMLLEKSEDYALLLVENLNHQVFTQFIIPIALKYGKIQLRDKDQFERLDKVVRSTLHSFKVEMVNIYDTNNTILYSFDKSMIGKKKFGGTAYNNAVLSQTTSTFIQRGNLWEIWLGFPKESRIITFAPLRAEKSLSKITGRVLGIVEIVQDLSEDQHTIYELQILVIQTSSLVMGAIFIVLLLLVKRGENIIEKRTHEKIQLKEQLNRAKHLASLGEMTAGISHEIRNPLGIISSSAALLKKKMAMLDPADRIPDIIVEESGRLNDIITDFLDYAKPKAPDLKLCSITEIVEKTITFLTPQIEKKGYKINKYYSNNLADITADPDMLHQAFLNIFLNSIQSMPNGGKIHVAVGSSENCIFIYLGDEGEGIPEDILEKIWDPFFTTKDKGTGLGLGVVKNIIESHDGIIMIENRPVRGTQITIELPVTPE